MTPGLVILPEAERDVQNIYEYLHARSPEGAASWFQSFLAAAARIVTFPESHSLAPEDELVKRGLRQFLFRTKSGRTYRGVFLVVADEVRILRVRGPGQPPLRQQELSGIAE